MFARLVFASTALCSSGCITHCYDETYYRASLDRQPGTVSPWSDPTSLSMDVVRGLSLELFECGYAHRRADQGPVHLCMKVIPETSVSFRFASDRIQVFDASGGELQSIAFTQLGYTIFCRRSAQGEDCSSDTVPQPGAELAR